MSSTVNTINYTPSNFNPFNTDSATTQSDNPWVYYTYYNTGTYTLNLTTSSILNKNIYYFIVGQGGYGHAGGLERPRGNPGKQSDYINSSYKCMYDNLNIDITLGQVDRDNTTLSTPTIILKDVSNVNATTITTNISGTNGYEKTNSSPISGPSIVTFSDTLQCKYVDTQGITRNPNGRYVGGGGGNGGGSKANSETSTGGNGYGGGGGAEAAGGKRHSGGTGLNGYSGGNTSGARRKNGGDGGRGFNFDNGGVGGGGGGGQGDLHDGQGGAGGLGAIMIYYQLRI